MGLVWLLVSIIVVMVINNISNGGGEILVGISCRMVRGWYHNESVMQVPSFKAIDSRKCWEAMAVQVMVLGHHRGSLSAVKVVMVTMTF